MPLPPKALALTSLALTHLFWATNTILARFFSDDIAPLKVTFIRWLLALLLLLPFTGKALYSQLHKIRRHWLIIVVLGLLGVTIFNSVLYLAAHSTTAVNITLVNSALPLVTLLMSWLLLSQKPSKWQLAGILISIIGVTFVVSEGKIEQLTLLNINRGDVLILGIVCCWSLYSVILRKYPIDDLTPTVLLTALIFAGLPVLAILAIIEQNSLPSAAWLHISDLPLYIYMAVFPSILAYLFWAYGVHVVGPNISSLSCYLAPLFTALMAIPLLGEKLYWYHFCGGALILIGLYLGVVFQQKS